MTLRLVPGADFTADEIRAAADRDIDVDLSGTASPLGGMTYRIDPDLEAHIRRQAAVLEVRRTRRATCSSAWT